ncbi:hypothetical protein J6590_051982 [Homalodisca vitripennis]|nr:hypothetical protein J6590_051982 [Homalodisca vitripennis]
MTKPVGLTELVSTFRHVVHEKFTYWLWKNEISFEFWSGHVCWKRCAGPGLDTNRRELKHQVLAKLKKLRGFTAHCAVSDQEKLNGNYWRLQAIDVLGYGRGDDC